MSDTTIAISQDTKQLLDRLKQDHESYNDLVRRLAGKGKGQLWTEEEIAQIAIQTVEREMR